MVHTHSSLFLYKKTLQSYLLESLTLSGLGPASNWAGAIQSLWNSSIHLWYDSEAVTVLCIHSFFECDLAFKCKKALMYMKLEKKNKFQRNVIEHYCADFALMDITLLQKIQGKCLIRSLFPDKRLLEPFEFCIWKLWSCLILPCWAW